MKDYKEIADRVIACRDEHLRRRKEKIKLLGTLCCVCLVVIFGVGTLFFMSRDNGYSSIIDQFGDGDVSGKSEYNKNIKTDKPNGSMVGSSDCEAELLADFVKMSDAVFIGNVMSDGEKITIGGSDFTKTKIAAQDVIYGTITDDEISFIQAGAPDTDDDEIKVKKGDSVLVIAIFDDETQAYRSVMYENGIFYIRDNGLYTYSNKVDLGKYDGTATKLLIRDIKAMK